MIIRKLRPHTDGWHCFNLNVGGFTIKNCRWNPRTKSILFPVRYDQGAPPRPHKVVFAYGAQVKRLRALLDSGQTRTPRDRRPCLLKIHSVKQSRFLNAKLQQWLIFDFTVRGFTILGCRWLPETGSIQLPVTYFYGQPRYFKRQVVCAYGAHINRLRKALEAALPRTEQAEPVDAHDAWIRRNPEAHFGEPGVVGTQALPDAQMNRGEIGGDLV